ncbi:MAG: XRE family transcriptional regulator [Arcicella sp.]|nr:XRE family transcriptional regulator [Arcicella sp.]
MQANFQDRLISARKMAGFSLEDLSEKMKAVAGEKAVSRQAIHQFEQGKSKPEADTMLALAKTLGVDLNYFFRESVISLGKIEYRKKTKLTKTEDVAVQEKAKDVLERYFELEELMNVSLIFKNPLEASQCHITHKNDIEIVAEALREKWDLGTRPIQNVLELLENEGIKVVEISTSDGFQGFYADANNHTVVVLNQNDDNVRKRFTALHELGHTILTFEDGFDVEKGCHSFAGAMLLPKKQVIQAFSEKRKKISLAELIQLKINYGISIQAILARLKNLEIINDSIFKGFIIWMTKVGYRKNEPGEYTGIEKALRFNQLLFRAAAEEIISLSKAASLGNMSLTTFRNTLIGK